MAEQRLSAGQQEQVWERWRAGASLSRIGRDLGVSMHWVRRFLLACGGIRRPPPRRPARALSAVEREEVSRGLAAGWSCRVIAAGLGRPACTVSREVARNGGREHYRAGDADRAAEDRRRRPQSSKLAEHSVLRAAVAAKLELQWSPEQIAAWLVVEFPDVEQMRVSHETIYLSLFVQTRGGLRRELASHLRSGRLMRHPRGVKAPTGRGHIKNMVPISARPAEVADRAVPGHWEGDLVFGRRPSVVGTLVERSSRYVQLFALPDGFKAPAVRTALTGAVGRLPEQLWRSLTWDQGYEMAEHATFTVDTGIQVYFCDPKSPWQRGSNENTVSVGRGPGGLVWQGRCRQPRGDPREYWPPPGVPFV